MNRLFTFMLALLPVSQLMSKAAAHDTWVEVNSPYVRSGDPVFVNLCLGNHGNSARDYRLASRLAKLDGVQLVATYTDGESLSLVGSLKSFGSAEKEGYWTAVFHPQKDGQYVVEQKLDILHGPARAVHGGRAFFSVGDQSQLATDWKLPNAQIEMPLQLTPITSPYDWKVGSEVEFKVFFQGKPLPDARVSFLPLGVELGSEFDDKYERTTDANGTVRFAAPNANRYLVVTKLKRPEDKGDGYDATYYTATCTLVASQMKRGN